MRSQGWWLALLLGCSLNGAVHARSLDQQVFQLQLVMDQIRLARSMGDRVGVCVESRRANNLVLDLLPALQLHRPGLNHAALQDRILLGFDDCSRIFGRCLVWINLTPRFKFPCCADQQSDSDNCSTGLLQKFQG